MEQMFNFPEKQDLNRKDVLAYLFGLGATIFIILLLLLVSSLSARSGQPAAKNRHAVQQYHSRPVIINVPALAQPVGF